MLTTSIPASVLCADSNSLNFDAEALCDNGSCVFADAVVSNLEDSFNQTVSTLNNDLDSTNSTLNEVIDTWQSSIDLTNATLDEVSQMNQTIASFTTLIDLQEGWNMIGYGCPESVNIEQGMSMYTDLVLLIKDNNGSVYLPEFNFNGIGDFTPGYGYQLKLSEPIEDFGLCGDYTNTESPEITDIETDNAQMQNDINCLKGNPEIGDYCYGGIVFYVEEGEEGKYGLVAAMEDLTEGATDPNGFGFNGYEWGCMSEDVSGADGQDLGTGYQNTMDIVSQGCVTQNGGITAAQAALDAEVNGYIDWYLPSIDELNEMYNTIGPGGLESNLGGFDTSDWPYYWSSSEDNSYTAWNVNFSDGYPYANDKDYTTRVRVIRAF